MSRRLYCTWLYWALFTSTLGFPRTQRMGGNSPLSPASRRARRGAEGAVAEQLERRFPVRTFRSRGQSEDKLRLEVAQDAAVRRGRGVVGLVDDEIIELARGKAFQMLRHTLD